jgi:transposase-like protein
MPEYQPVSSSNLDNVGQRCPRCHQPRMILSKVESGPNDSDYRTFECQHCGRTHTLIVSSDPMESGIRGLLDEELKPTR